MNLASHPDLVKITEVFLIPSSFLVAALGTADTNPHRAGVSLIGLVVSILWWVCSREALAEWAISDAETPAAARPRRMHILAWLPVIFTTGWVLSLIAHLLLWSRPLGQ